MGTRNMDEFIKMLNIDVQNKTEINNKTSTPKPKIKKTTIKQSSFDIEKLKNFLKDCCENPFIEKSIKKKGEELIQKYIVILKSSNFGTSLKCKGCDEIIDALHRCNTINTKKLISKHVGCIVKKIKNNELMGIQEYILNNY